MRAIELRAEGSAAKSIVSMSITSRWQNAGLVAGVSVAIGVWILHQAGCLDALDGVFYDRLLSWTTRWRQSEPKVLLLRLGREDAWSDAEAIKTLDVLESFGAKAVAINFVPYRNSTEFFRRAAGLRNVVFGRELRPDPDDPDTLRLDAWPAAARDLHLPWGVVFLPPGARGIHRRQETHVVLGTDTLPTLERRVAAVCDPTLIKPASSGSFLIDFQGGPGAIPNVSLSHVLAGELIAEMVRGKVVLVGPESRLLGLDTPVSGGTQPMSLLEFEGNALQTMLDGTPIRALPWVYELLLLLCLGIAGSLIYQRFSSGVATQVVLGMLGLCALAAVAGLVYFRFWLPLGPLMLALVGHYAVTLGYKARTTHLAVNGMRLRALTQIGQRFTPQSVLSSSEYWDQLAAMVHQTLHVGRMAILERVPDTRRLREIKTFNCSFKDMPEKGLTLEASVFAAALAQGRPVCVSGLLERGQMPEVEYVCPLVFASEMLGMWVVGIDSPQAAKITQIEDVLAKFSRQVARLLYHRKGRSDNDSPVAGLKAWLSGRKEDPVYRELRTLADLLEQYYDVLDTVFRQISSATIVYDAFGRVLKANELAFTLLEPENVVPTRAAALDFLRLVTGKDESEVRQLLRGVLLEGATISTSVKLASQPDRRFLLRLYPLPEQAEPRPLAVPFDVQGMVCELIETTSLSTLASLKSVVADRLGVELRNHLAAIEISAALLETDSIQPSERQTLLETIHLKSTACVHVISQCQKYLGRDVDASPIRCFPLDALQVLGRVCLGFAHKAERRRVTLKVEQPRVMSQVLASTTELGQLFSSTLELLLNDAAENTALTIEVEDFPSRSVFRFRNSGFGIPNERLQEILVGPPKPDSEEFQVFRQASSWVRNWGGNLEITSGLGKGYSISLQLRQFP